ncbi:hypothetical protein O4H49_15810 [Kiloniella laminariae]|uniref:Nickel/cobalt efflux system n=1 Tax=Kiloniella laminariae TaxID=454162 RepID=A0ABT4LMF5_9PROT|nr:hypothetical protein [Kiloniella laminariae]MCZ4282254.1 hypothetical protein [Kiloniella laminariae]
MIRIARGQTWLQVLFFLFLLAGTILLADALFGVVGIFPSEEAGIWASFLETLRSQQRAFSSILGDGVRALGDGLGFDSLIHLVWICFLYGVFHALGPGHGKAVIATYTLSTDTKIRSVVGLSMAASFMQGLTAITIVGLCYLLIDSGVRSASLAAESVMEPLSYGAVVVVGGVLLWRGLRLPASQCCAHDHSDEPGHSHVSVPQKPNSEITHSHSHVHRHDGLSAGNAKGHDCCASSVPRSRLSGLKPYRDIVAIVLAIGIRPCTGALLVLILAFVLGHWAGGLAAVLAMSLGTGLTVSLLALAAKGVRFPLLKILDELGVQTAIIARVVSIGGGLLIILIGGTLLLEVLMTPDHPFM